MRIYEPDVSGITSPHVALWRFEYREQDITKKGDGLYDISFLCCGSWTRTNDLRVMSPTSYHCSIPRSIFLFERETGLKPATLSLEG